MFYRGRTKSLVGMVWYSQLYSKSFYLDQVGMVWYGTVSHIVSLLLGPYHTIPYRAKVWYGPVGGLGTVRFVHTSNGNRCK